MPCWAIRFFCHTRVPWYFKYQYMCSTNIILMIGMPSTSLQHQVRHAVLKTVEGLTLLLLADTSQPLSVQSSAERAALV